MTQTQGQCRLVSPQMDQEDIQNSLGICSSTSARTCGQTEQAAQPPGPSTVTTKAHPVRSDCGEVIIVKNVPSKFRRRNNPVAFVPCF